MLLSPGERRFLSELHQRGVRYLLIGASAANAQGARIATVDMDLWFEDLKILPLERIIVSKRAAGRRRDLAQIPALEEALAVLKEKNPEGQ